MFSLSGLLPTTTHKKGASNLLLLKQNLNRKRKKKAPIKKLTGCVGTAMNLSERNVSSDVSENRANPYGYACSLRCKHPVHTKDRRSRSFSQGKSADWIPEDIYRRYTETDSRPLTPLNRRSVSVPRGLSVLGKGRKCVTPEPEARQCQFHHRRVLILDLRRVKSVDAIGRQDSRSPGTSVDSTYGDDDIDNPSSSANFDSSSVLYQFSPRNVSLSRSATPKTKQRKGKKKSKERSSSPIIYERSTSPKILEGLTLPPLHSSVLTLLGQRSGVKPSPRNLLVQAQEPSTSSGASRHKKLRRHGRNRTKGERKGKTTEESKQGQRAGSEEVKKTDEPHETQLSAFADQNAEFSDDQLQRIDENEKFQVTLNNFAESRRALYHVLDDHLAGKPWSAKELTSLEDEIDKVVKDFQRYPTKFQTTDIKMKEDTWLSFPRTWSRSSATFGVPYDTRSLKQLKPLDYLEKYVTVSEPRKHLYSLVFQRNRMKENPTGKSISLKTVQAALSEVLGRTFLAEEMDQLCNIYLGLKDRDTPISEMQFNGISAYCERTYAEYSLEEHHECHTCCDDSMKDKLRCHQNQKSQLEKADLAYLSHKIRDGQVQNNLSELLQALCERD